LSAGLECFFAFGRCIRKVSCCFHDQCVFSWIGVGAVSLVFVVCFLPAGWQWTPNGRFGIESVYLMVVVGVFFVLVLRLRGVTSILKH